MFRIRTALFLLVICSGAGSGLQLLEPNSQSPTKAALTPLDLPMPTGPHSIGTKVYNWVDRSRHEQASKNPSDFRQLVVQVWYPSEDGSRPTAPYVPMLRSYRHVWEDSDFETASRTLTHSRVNAKPMSSMQLPVVLLSHGWDGTRSEYTSIAEDLASHGYAVFGVDHPYMGRIALPSGEVTEPSESQFHSPSEIVVYYARDLEFVIGQIAELNRSDPEKTFTGKFDMERIAAIGHSSGFVAASGACKLDSRIKACVNIDAPGFSARDLAGLDQPLLWIRLQKAGAVPAEYLKTVTAAVYELNIEGASHGSVEDWDYLEAVSPARRAAAANVLRIIEQHVEAFFSKHLDRQNASLLNAGVNMPALQWKVYSPVASPSPSRQP
jgi:alpha-beta hydrolase superfamily lysophospholipase